MKSKIITPLAIITLVLWGFILYSVAEIVFFKEDNSEIITSSETPLIKKNISQVNRFYYKTLPRDPFSLIIDTREKSIDSSRPPQNILPPVPITEEKPIKFTVSGVVINNRNKRIILKDQMNNVVFLDEGSEYNNMQLTKVCKAHVEFKDIKSGKTITIQVL